MGVNIVHNQLYFNKQDINGMQPWRHHLILVPLVHDKLFEVLNETTSKTWQTTLCTTSFVLTRHKRKQCNHEDIISFWFHLIILSSLRIRLKSLVKHGCQYCAQLFHFIKKWTDKCSVIRISHKLKFCWPDQEVC